MRRSWWYKFVFLLVTLVVSILHVLPTLFPEIDVKKFPVKERINLGLDLQGGLYMVMGAQFSEVFRESIERSMRSMVDSLKEQGFTVHSSRYKEGSPPLNPQVELQIASPEKSEEFRAAIKKDYGSLFRIVLQKEGRFVLAFTSFQLDSVRKKTVEQSIEVIRNRIDKFGVSEPVITSQGVDKILIELPGVKDIDRAKSIIGQTAKLEFQIVDDKSLSPAKLQELVDKTTKENVFPKDLAAYVERLNQLVGKGIPAGTEIAFERVKNQETGKVVGKQPYLLKKKVDVTGEDLQDAFVSVDQENNMPFVSLDFNYRGGVKFEKLTGENVGKRLAIVLDGIVYSAPVLQEKISQGRARITMGQGDYRRVFKESSDLSIVLRAGALPTKLEFQEQRVVGPSLGADSIEAGRQASLLALVIVLFFMLFYYKKSGIISGVALLCNSLFIFAILVGLEATLTLPGIAGIALTLGMAVDANVIIYERIREELRAGKSAVAALDQGFNRALGTILDANITTAVAAIVLMEFGSGPIRGFAVTLLIGIVTSLFSAIFVSRVLFDFWVKRSVNRKMISI